MKKLSKITVLIIVLILCILTLTGCGKEESETGVKTIKDETITAENFDDISKRIQEEMKDDEEVYYLTYSMMYHITKDGLSSALTNPNGDESAIYANIYGKTIKQLISEGKQFMKDNNITLEQYKQQIEQSGN